MERETNNLPYSCQYKIGFVNAIKMEIQLTTPDLIGIATLFITYNADTLKVIAVEYKEANS